MISLRAHLVGMSNIISGIDDRERLRAALFVAAEATLSRIREVGNKYNLTEGVEKVENELRDDGSRSAMVPPKLYRAEPVADVPSTEPEML